MLSQNKEEYKKLIPLRRLAKEVPYKVTYLSLLVQRGKLRAEKIGRNYFTTREWFGEYLEMHARSGKVEKLEENLGEELAEKRGVREEIKLEEKEAGERVIKKRREELDLSVLEKADEKSESLNNWSERANEEEKNITRIMRMARANPGELFVKKKFRRVKANGANTFITDWGNKVFKNFSGIVNSLAGKSRKLIFNFWRTRQAKLAAICLATLVAAFSFSFFAPGVSASFARGLDKTLAVPVEATRAIVKSAEEAMEEASGLVAESPAFKKANQYANGMIGEVKKITEPVKEKLSRQIFVLAEEAGATWQPIYENKIQPNVAVIKKGISRIMTAKEKIIVRAEKLIEPAKEIKKIVSRRAENFTRRAVVAWQNFYTDKIEYKNNILDTYNNGRGRVAGISEAAGHSVIAEVRSFASEMSGTARDFFSSALKNLAQAQRDLSFKLNRQVADLTLASAGRVKGVSEAGGGKLALLGTDLTETNERVKNYTEISRVNFLKETSRSTESLLDLYTKFIDFIIPDSLKRYYSQQQEEKKLVEVPAKEVPAKEGGAAAIISPTAPKVAAPAKKPAVGTAPLTPVTSAPAVSAPVSASPGGIAASTQVVVQPQTTVLPSSTGLTTIVGGNLLVRGAATFNDDLIVGGTIYGDGPVKVGGGLNVSGPSEFSGNVSVGSTLSANNATINSNLNVGGTLNTNFLNVSGTFSAGHTQLTSLGVSSFASAIGLSAGTEGLISSGGLSVSKDSSGNIVDIFDGSNEVFMIASGGNIGIGTTSPNHLLDIAGNLGLGEGQYINWGYTDGSNGYGLRDSSGTLQFKNSGGTWTNIGSASGGTWDISGTSIYYTDGNVGIGTSTPYSKFSVWGAGAGTDRLFELTNNASTTLMYVLENGSGYLLGNFGIGTTTASSKLSVYGNLFVEGENRYLNFGTTTSSNGYGFRDNAGAMEFKSLGGSWAAIGSGGSLTGSALAKGLFLVGDDDGLSQATSSIFVSSTGNVGIGTTTPYSRLSVWGAGSGANRLFELTNTASTTLFYATEDGNIYAPVATATTTISGGFTAGNNAGLTVNKAAPANSFYINPSGYLGVNTAAPSSQFYINGTAGVSALNIASTTGYSMLSINSLGAIGIQNDSWIYTTDTTGTSTNLVKINSNHEIEFGAPILTGSLEASEDAGQITLFNMPVSSSAAAGTKMSAGLAIDSNQLLTVYAESDAAGGIRNSAVGIGTTSPYAKLSVAGDIAADGTITASSLTATSSISAPYFTATSASATSTFAGGLAIETSGFVYDYSSGNVGIGTAAPGDYKLNVNGSIYTSNTIYGNGVTIGSNSGELFSDSSTGFKFLTGEVVGAGVERMRIIRDGFVGIGTTSPYALLSLSNSASTAVNTPLFTIASTTAGTATSTLFTVLANGYVGIGTTSPTGSLEVASGQILIEGGSSLIPGLAQISNKDTGIYIANDMVSISINGTGVFGVGNTSMLTPDNVTFDGDASLGYRYLAADKMAIYTASTNRLVIDAVGNIGIGTTTPYSKLSVWGAGAGTNRLFELTDTASTTLMSVLENGTGYLSGKFGIGTSSPLSKLSVQGVAGQSILNIASSTGGSILSVNDVGQILVETGSATYPTIAQSSNTDTGIYFGSSVVNFTIDGTLRLGIGGGTLQTTNNVGFLSDSSVGYHYLSADKLGIYTANLDRLVVDADGNIGIGTTTPYSHLSVWGAGAGTNRLFELTNSASTTLVSFLENGTGYFLGNLGIGTTSPYATLSVAGNIAVDGTITVSAITATSSISISSLATPAGTFLAVDANGLVIATTSPTGGGWNSLDDILLAKGNFIVGDDAGAAQATSTLFISSLGKIGIGTTSPAYTLDVAGSARLGTGDEVMRLTTAGNVGIGTTSPYAKLAVVKASPAENEVIFAISTSTSETIFTVDEDGDIAYDGAASSPSADYAEYFYTVDTDLQSGETVCVDVAKNNAVERCKRVADGNLMGVVSTKPAIIGNNKAGFANNPNYKIIAMLGQIPAKVSAENGPIRPGDSLTSASSTPGYAMRANAGDPTVGVALESLDSEKGEINVLISRRNKSLTVEQVEEQVTKRIANMEIEDEVNILIANAINNLDLDQEIGNNVDPKLLLLETKLTVASDDMGEKIVSVENEIDAIINVLAGMENRIMNYELGIRNQFSIFNDQLASLTSQITNYSSFAMAMEDKLSIDNNGKMSVNGIAGVEIVTATSTETTAFVINQSGSGDIADFQANEVSVLNINNSGKVSIVGTLLVDGRIMACAGGACGSALEEAVDETAGDIGVEGKVVAGAFEGYCEDGFVWAPGSAKYGTLPGFCVQAKLANTNQANLNEMNELEAGGIAVNLSQGEAQLTCQELGDNYHLMNDNEWMTIAENILRARTNTDSSGLTRKNENGAYVLNNGNEFYINDGIGEWIDKIITRAELPISSSAGWTEYSEISDFKGLDIAPPYYLNSDNGIGKIKVTVSGGNSRAFVRGQSGIFGLDLSYGPMEFNENIGFRCAK
ncbi:MAG: hypothetical protein PHR36_00855 [Patescibacteria group bacterium]|nr:hypothetical protein [Patescibacteria group bacterium]